MSKTTTVSHPLLPGVTRDVEDPDAWTASGWVAQTPAKPASTKRAPQKGRASTAG